jgi:hypothetical protein
MGMTGTSLGQDCGLVSSADRLALLTSPAGC